MSHAGPDLSPGPRFPEGGLDLGTLVLVQDPGDPDAGLGIKLNAGFVVQWFSVRTARLPDASGLDTPEALTGGPPDLIRAGDVSEQSSPYLGEFLPLVAEKSLIV